MAISATIGYGILGGFLGTSITLTATWNFFIQPIWKDISKIFAGKKIDLHQENLTKLLKELEKGLMQALIDFDQNSNKGYQTAQHTLAHFLSDSKYEFTMNQKELSSFQDLFIELRTNPLLIPRIHLETAYKRVAALTEKIQGRIGKIKNFSEKFFSYPVQDSSDKTSPHPLIKIGQLKESKNNPLKDDLMTYYLSQLEWEDVTIYNLNDQIEKALISFKTTSPKRYIRLAKKFGIDPSSLSSSYELYIAYDKMRKKNLLLPQVNWKASTNCEVEKQKIFDLATSVSLFAIFKLCHQTDPLINERFYERVSNTYFMAPEERKRVILNFFKDQRKSSWISSSVEQAIFSTTYKVIRTSLSSFAQNITTSLKVSPLPSITYVGEKVSRYFHHLNNTYAKWCKKHAYDLELDAFFIKTLNQNHRYAQVIPLFHCNLTHKIEKLNDRLRLWADRPIFQKDSSLLTAFKQSIVIPVRIGCQLMKILAIFTEQLIHSILIHVTSKILFHTPLFEKAYESLKGRLAHLSPNTYPILETILDHLEEILDMMKSNPPRLALAIGDEYQAKQALKESIKTFIRFAKSLDSLNPEEKSLDVTLFETALPPIIHQIFDLFQDYLEKEDWQEQATQLLQAFNFSAYHQNSSMIDKDLIETCNKQIELSFRKITRKLLSQYLPKNLLKHMPSPSQTSQPTKFIQSYMSKNQALIKEVMKKTYLIKGFFVHLMRQ